MMKNIIFIIFLISHSAFADYEWQIANSTETLKKLKRPDPAHFKIAKPEGQNSDYDIILGYIGTFGEKEISPIYGFDTSVSTSIKLNANRDTLTDSPNNNWDIGIGTDFHLDKFENRSHDPVTTAMNVGTEVKYKKDEIKNLSSGNIIIDFLPYNLFKADTLRSVFKSKKDKSKYVQGMIFNLGYESVIDAPPQDDGSDGEGRNTRFWILENFKLYPLYKWKGESLEISYSGEFGVDVDATGLYENQDDTWVHHTASINYYLTCEKTFAIGISYFSGERRRENREDIEESEISLKFKWPPASDEIVGECLGNS